MVIYEHVSTKKISNAFVNPMGILFIYLFFAYENISAFQLLLKGRRNEWRLNVRAGRFPYFINCCVKAIEHTCSCAMANNIAATEIAAVVLFSTTQDQLE